MSHPRPWRRPALTLLAALGVLGLGPAAGALPFATPALAAVGGLPDGFRDELLHGGLDFPVSVQFSQDGRVFVAEKSGRIVAFDGPGDQTPSTVANLQAQVHNFWDRGLLGFALAPSFPADPSIYVLYTFNSDPNGGPVPRWVGTSVASDPCPTPPGPTADGCVVTGRLSRLTVSGGVAGGETVLVEDWCNQFPSHTVGHLAFGPDGALYASGGDGASFMTVDYGQLGGTLPSTSNPAVPRNPCGDPPGGVGGQMTAATAEGGALRAQDIRTRGEGDPVGLSGTIIRVNPASGLGWATNALSADPDANARRIVAHGLRNPFRFAVHPSGSLWIGDVGLSTWEEINELPDPDAAPVNFGWPCREGAAAQSGYSAAGLGLCTSLAASATRDPHFAYRHSANVVTGDGCGLGGSSISGLAFLPGSSGYPSAYHGSLFFSDYSRGCIWRLPQGADGRPSTTGVQRFADLRPAAGETGGAVYLTVAPNGDLVYADYDRGEIRRIHYYGPNVPPTAAFTATPSSGAAPLPVTFDASASSDPNVEPLTYAWDLDGDGAYDDATGQTAARTYTVPGDVTVGLRVTDGLGLSDTASRVVSAGNSAPSVSWTQPSASLTWSVGETIAFAATASDLQDSTLPASAFHWTLSVEHCPDGCHSHIVTSWSGVRSGSFVAPAHDVPSHLRLVLRVTDSLGLTTTMSRDLHPRTVVTTAASQPAGVPLSLGDLSSVSNPSVTSVANALISVAAPEFHTIGETTYRFASWSDGGARVHEAVAGQALVATYVVHATADAANTCSAAAIKTPGYAWHPGRLASSTDVDWYRFTLSATTRVQVTLGDVGVPSRLELYRGCSTRIAIADRAGNGMEEILAVLPAGTHAVRVSGAGSATAPPNVLRIRPLTLGVKVLSTRAIQSGSTLRLVGELYNNSSLWRGPVTVTARLYDAAGRLLATRTATADLPYLAPLGRTPFRIIGSLPSGFHHATFSQSAPPTTARTTAGSITARSAVIDALGRYVVTGTVRNGSRAVSQMRVVVTLLDGRGLILEGGLAKLGRTSLAASQSTSFSLTFTTPGLRPNLVAIRASGR